LVGQCAFRRSASLFRGKQSFVALRRRGEQASGADDAPRERVFFFPLPSWESVASLRSDANDRVRRIKA
jgi:hypothetical protein